MQTIWRDIRYAARMLVRKPGFTIIALLTLALGIAVTTATFTVVDAVGSMVQSVKLTDLQTTSQLQSPGIYFWQVEQRGRLIDCGMLICQ